MDGKDNKEEKTREVPDIRMYHISWNFLQLGRDMLWWWWLTWKLFLLSTCLTTLSTCGLVFDGTVDGNDNKEEKTREVANTRMYHFGRNQLTCTDCVQICWKYEKNHMSTTITTEYHSLVNENFNLCDTSYVRYLPGLLLLVVLAVHSAVDHQTTWAKIRQVGY